jgi:hypothetical protein
MAESNGPMWWFEPVNINATHEQSNEVQFFAEQDAADRLVRETVQNAMDAATGDETVRLSFTFTTLARESGAKYFEGLVPHLRAQPKLDRKHVDALNQDVPCLVIEDFGTSGLTGPLVRQDAMAARADEPGHRLHFFFMNFGITGKQRDHLGSFGIGKTVFQYSSRINSFFGLSTRSNGDGLSTVCAGQARLEEHVLDSRNELLHHTGLFARMENEVLQAITDTAFIEAFRRDFGLRRQSGEKGLSVVVALPDTSIDRNRLLRSAAAHFFMRILQGKLVFEVGSQGEEPVVLDHGSFDSALDRIEWGEGEKERMRRRVELARWILAEGRSLARELPRPADAKSPRVPREAFTKEECKQLYRELHAGRRLAFRVPVPIEPKGHRLTWSEVMVYMEYEPGNDRCDDLYLRGGLTLVDHAGKQARCPGLRSILIAEPPEVGDDSPSAYALLRASENVSHTRWRRNDVPRLTQEYIRGTKKVSYVLDIVRALAGVLLTPEDEADYFTLAALLPRPAPSPLPVTPEEPDPDAPDETEDEPSSNVDDETNPGQPPDDLEPSLRQALHRPIKSGDVCGFVVRPNPKFDKPPRPLRIQAAYGMPGKRNRFKQHREEDFSFKEGNGIQIVRRNAAVDRLDHNTLLVTPSNRDYEVMVTGFSPHVALDYSVTVEASANDDEGGD